jgi:hypothetical protein
MAGGLPTTTLGLFQASDKFVIPFPIISFLHGREKWIAMR